MENWTQFAIETLQPIILALLSLGLAYATALIRRKVLNEQAREVSLRAADAVFDAVAAAEQTFVRVAKSKVADGKLTAGEAREAAQIALANARQLLGPKGIAEVRAILGTDSDAVDKHLLTLIEAKIQELKAGQ